MRDLMQDLRFAVRQMARRPGLTAFAVLSLALGIGVNSSMFTLAAGLGLAFAGAQLLRGMLYGIAPSDPLTFVGVAVVLGSVALGANLIPAQRATQVDPLVALRYE